MMNKHIAVRAANGEIVVVDLSVMLLWMLACLLVTQLFTSTNITQVYNNLRTANTAIRLEALRLETKPTTITRLKPWDFGPAVSQTPIAPMVPIPVPTPLPVEVTLPVLPQELMIATTTMPALPELVTPKVVEVTRPKPSALPAELQKPANVVEFPTPQITVEQATTKKSMPLPSGKRPMFHAYMGYKAVTSKRSPQYALINHPRTVVGEEGILVHVDEDGEMYYGIAVGTAYSRTVGETFEVEFADGGVRKCIVMDIKSDAHTDPTRRFSSHGGNKCVVEVVVDPKQVPKQVRRMGSYHVSETFGGAVVAIAKLGDSDWLADRRNPDANTKLAAAPKPKGELYARRK